MQLPDEDCYAGAEEPEKPECGEYEFSCGNGQCISGLGVCDRRRDCLNGADEAAW